MEFLVASTVGVLTAAGVYLVLRQRTFPVILGLSREAARPARHCMLSGQIAMKCGGDHRIRPDHRLR